MGPNWSTDESQKQASSPLGSRYAAPLGFACRASPLPVNTEMVRKVISLHNPGARSFSRGSPSYLGVAGGWVAHSVSFLSVCGELLVTLSGR